MKKEGAFFLLMIITCCDIYAQDWKKIDTGLFGQRMYCVTSDEAGKGLYIGTDRRLYSMENGGQEWNVVFQPKGEEKRVSHVYEKAGHVYVCGGFGIYSKALKNGTWEKVFEDRFKDMDIRSVVIFQERIFVLSAHELHVSYDNGMTWTVAMRSGGIAGDMPGAPEILVDETAEVYTRLTEGDDGRYYLSSTKGLFVSNDGKDWAKLSLPGMEGTAINQAMAQNGHLYMASASGVFRYNRGAQPNTPLYRGLESVNVNGLAIGAGGALFCVTDSALYELINMDTHETGAADMRDLGPSIGQVRDMAVKYAEVSPEKIVKWRKACQLKAFLPDVSFGIDHDTSDTYDIYTSATANYCYYGPKDNSDGWDVRLTWDLGDLIYSDAQTSIDVRSKLMVELRNDILNDATRLYYERKRVMLELAGLDGLSPGQKVEKQLRVEELTASLDALTGGGFSARADE